jgi:NAD(P)-dependent dehydrogenase (short-subunit alcohol dehydrogenase family)
VADLTGRTALVTGAGRGIGAAVAEALDRAGARVALVSRSISELESVARRLTHSPVIVLADLAEPQAPTVAVEAALDSFDGRLDVLVNNAGIALRKQSDAITADEIDHLFAVNVRAALLACAAALPAMVEQRSGSIVSISSISGRRGAARRSAYAATKAALDGMTRAIAMEYGPVGIRANAVAPGVVETDMWTQALERPGVADAVLGVIPLRRLTTVDEVADVVTFLASDASSAITGEVISVDGGIHGTVNLWPTV